MSELIQTMIGNVLKCFEMFIMN